MKNEKILIIFGAPNQEERVARRIAEKSGCQTATATYQGKSVNAGNAYKADGIDVDIWDVKNPEKALIFFKCWSGEVCTRLWDWFEFNGMDIIRCGHFHPGYLFMPHPVDFFGPYWDDQPGPVEQLARELNARRKP